MVLLQAAYGAKETQVSDFSRHAGKPVVPAWEAETVRLHYLQDGVSATARPGQRGHAGGGCAAPDAKFYVAELSAVAVLVAASNVPVYGDL